jgi:uncharacterized protein (TIGR00255 family)
MLLSMTGYGSAAGILREADFELELSVEIKTLNSKYLDLQCRLPRVYNSLERDLGLIIREKLKRGRVEVSVYRRVLQGPVQELAVNVQQARALAEAFKRVEMAVEIPTALTLADLLSQPDWLQSKEPEIHRETEWKLLQDLAQKALEAVSESREQEGRSLHRILYDHRVQFEKVFQELAQANEQLVPTLRERWSKRLKEIAPDVRVDANRLEQELVLWVSRADYQEEIDRIRHHLEVFDKIMAQSGEAGRRFEFLLQELHREVNTLGSKCDQKALTAKVVELKSYLEKMKEQVQNVE